MKKSEPCDHISLEGVDRVPVESPSKIWKCCRCGKYQVGDEEAMYRLKRDAEARADEIEEGT